MLGSDVLDVGIGIALLFLFTSLVCSAMREAVETIMKSRAMDLERGIRELLKEDDGATYVKKLFDHPSIFGLYTGSYDPTKLGEAKYILGATGTKIMPRAARSNLPTYIPSQNFSAALIDMVRSAGPGGPLSVASLRKGAEAIQNEPIKFAVLSALDETGDDLAKTRKSIEAWYDSAMDRVSGWYKRRTQVALLAIGLLTGVLFNIDAITIARHLATVKTYREAIVASVPAIRQALEKMGSDGLAGAKDADPKPLPNPAQKTKGQPPPPEALAKQDDEPHSDPNEPSQKHGADGAVEEVRNVLSAFADTGFALGWPPPQFADCKQMGSCGPLKYAGIFVQMVAGWIVTALAVSLGAPFWLDLLNKFMVVRSTIKPSEKSGREASKDSAAP